MCLLGFGQVQEGFDLTKRGAERFEDLSKRVDDVCALSQPLSPASDGLLFAPYPEASAEGKQPSKSCEQHEHIDPRCTK